MIFYFAIPIVLQTFFSIGKCDGGGYGRNSLLGSTARFDLLNGAKAAFDLGKPTKEERLALITFAEFMNTSSSTDYLEAFYSAHHNITKVNNFLTFLNGIIFGGNPSKKIWKAAIILKKMITTRVQLKTLEKIREIYRSKKKPRTSKIIMDNETKTVDFVKIFHDSSYIYIYSAINRIKSDYSRRKIFSSIQMDLPFSTYVFLILKQLDRKLYNRLRHETTFFQSKKLLGRRMLPKKDLTSTRVLAKVYRRQTGRPITKHVFYGYGNIDDSRRDKGYYRPHLIGRLRI